jgi:drug/metabolite transporter (DMT)-like permease
MANTTKHHASQIMVIIAFAIVYIVWGSTYFFIQKVVREIPPFFMGALRFGIAGILLLTWCIIKGENVWQRQQIKNAAISGAMMLFIGNGAVIWTEQTLASSLVAVLVSAAPLWFVLLDKPKWNENFKSRETIIGLIVGFAGVVLLFSESTINAFSAGNAFQFLGLIILIIGSISWSGGSLYAKYKSTGSTSVNTAWQMIAAGIAFLPFAFISGEQKNFQWQSVNIATWLDLSYLIFFGSLAAYSAYVWLLKVRSATQVSTYAYVNPVVAVLLGVFIGGEKMSLIQLAGLVIVLISVFLINRSKYRQTSNPKLKVQKSEGRTVSAYNK